MQTKICFEYDTQGRKCTDVQNKTQYTPIYAKQNKAAAYGKGRKRLLECKEGK